ncbi:UDP-3-O-[3-hydroxymyristoyl] glucosamine N-acyltransferase [Apibacter mensalis]|uniref:UDP-3-O-[3-hydroxymyristoyl] glucosamine N-acyltransferase n=1 Tax=Apibacter mensalis TaxID=1586267 RepID=A0A0X3AMK7_9FLAO|nr:UDP-3-O-(3-hydroxymyristoyl)glucosamine N-acyltransferase [Apibacter mensalis]CVK15463.1 UDP-3-O-[3-hydroxymyristoyl] glucosamine N-acyltransferase [Apibacter mensalis]
MKFPHSFTLKKIASIIGCEYVGKEDFPIYGTNEIHRVKEGEIVFVDHPKYYAKALHSKASVVLINKKVECPENKALLLSDDPFRDFNKINDYFVKFIPQNKLISDDVQIGKNTIIQPGVYIGKNVKIGNDCIIFPNVTIHDYTEIGNNVVIQSGTVLGGDGFYYKNRGSYFERLKSVGNVIIEDNVEIGSNCTIDRGVTASTIIGKGSKLDNLIQIGHDTVIGRKCLIASQVGIAGCCTIHDEVSIWGQAGFASSLTIGEKAIILAQSGVSKNLKAGKTYFGSPAEEAKKKLKELATLKNLAK